MTEKLLNCPFCGAGERLLSVQTYDVQPDDYHSGYVTCGECDAEGARPGEWLGDKEEAEQAAITAWNTRPRTEGRGDEPVASDKALFDALWELVAAMANEGIPQTPRTKAAFKVAHQAALDRLRKDWSSPIREPEISRTKRDDIEKLLRENLPEQGGMK